MSLSFGFALGGLRPTVFLFSYRGFCLFSCLYAAGSRDREEGEGRGEESIPVTLDAAGTSGPMYPTDIV